MKKITIGTDFSGVGAAEYAIERIANKKGFEVENVFACDMDKYARKSYLACHKEPLDYPNNVYSRNIPKNSLDIYVSSPPCQSFSLAGKRLGKNDKRGILFFNTHEFIQSNNPRYFIIENVKGLLSDDGGKTFSEWISLLGGKSINGNLSFFPHEDSVPYHIYWKVLNAKNYNVPQNRERVFIVGIRDDEDNDFSWAKEEPLTKRLKDVLESEVDEKYFLSDKMVNQLVNNNIDTEHLNIENKDFSNTLRVGGGKSLTEKHSFDMIKIVGNTNPSGNGMNGNVFDENGISPTLLTNKGEGIKVGTWRTHKDGQGFRECEDGTCPTIPARAREDGSGQPVIKVKSATSKGYEEATNEDSINFSNPHSKTRRGRVGKGVAQTLDTSCNQGVMVDVNSNIINPLKGKTNYGWHFEQNVYDEKGITRALKSSEGSGNKPKVIIDVKPVQLNKSKQFSSTSKLIGDENQEAFCIRSSEPNGVCIPVLTPDRVEKRQNGRRFKEDGEEMFTITTQDRHGIYNGYRIRRLTPIEVFRLMDFPDNHVEKCKEAGISDSQLYKQAGNSIVVRCLELIMDKLKLV
jgi:DNA (cytosine-5)-methyltransferase 1